MLVEAELLDKNIVTAEDARASSGPVRRDFNKRMVPVHRGMSARNPPVAALPEKKNLIATIGARAIFFSVVFVLAGGFAFRSSEIITPGEGIGYKLGIAGGISMLLLLLYPLFKRLTALNFQKHSVFWLRLHMLLGIVGPVFIFFHSNFSLGATNSNVALFSMIMVALSGVIGRYIYTRIHRGMSYLKLDLNLLLANSTRLMSLVGEDTGSANTPIAKDMADFAVASVPSSRSITINLLNAVLLPVRSRWARGRMMREVRRTVKKNGAALGWTFLEKRRRLHQASLHIGEFVDCAGRAAQFAFWERMFSHWHVFHVPLFFILLVSAVIHTVAVHVY